MPPRKRVQRKSKATVKARKTLDHKTTLAARARPCDHRGVARPKSPRPANPGGRLATLEATAATEVPSAPRRSRRIADRRSEPAGSEGSNSVRLSNMKSRRQSEMRRQRLNVTR
jgi:hypothetical protein